MYEHFAKDPSAGKPRIQMSEKWLREGVQPARGDGWIGHGAPIRVRQGYKVRDLEDGAGLCSPGRWSPCRRRLPDTDGLAGDLIRAMDLDIGTWDRNLMSMLAGKGEKEPFSAEELERGHVA